MHGRRAVAAKEFEKELATSSMDSNILDYCSLDPQVSVCALRHSCAPACNLVHVP